ncbi:MAG: SDR family oxidoreductase [Pseudomonadales bacterium]|nr:SDR family oxidoreductase [Pseudomonadales bacterium]
MSKTYVITGGSTGIGAAVKAKLLEAGHSVILIDLHNGDIEADLSKPDGRSDAIEKVKEIAENGIDGLVTCAGVGPHFEPVAAIAALNYYGTTELIKGLQPLLEKKRGAVVAVSSNSAILPGLDTELVSCMSENNEEATLEFCSAAEGAKVYAASKFAVIKWIRQNAAAAIRKGIRINVVAPGITETPLTNQAFSDERYGAAMQQFLQMTPIGKMASPDMIAKPILFLLSDDAEYMVGSLMLVDGGVDAQLRPTQF